MLASFHSTTLFPANPLILSAWKLNMKVNSNKGLVNIKGFFCMLFIQTNIKKDGHIKKVSLSQPLERIPPLQQKISEKVLDHLNNEGSLLY